MIKRGKFWFPDEDNHFNGDDYQVAHRMESLSHCDSFVVAIDIGAHVGTWTVDLAERFLKVYAFEPVKEHMECFIKNVGKNNVELFGCCLGYDLGDVSLSYAKEGNSGTTSITDYGKGDYESSICTLDSFQFDGVDYIKIDVEGYELQVLKGGSDTIQKNKPVINIEVKNTCERFGYTQQDILDYLKKLGMSPVGRTVDDWVWKYV